MSGFERDTIQRFLELAGERLSGDWVIIGGCVPHLLGIGTRTTVDIDIAGPDEAGMGQAVILMEVAEALGLPVESVNPSGAFFLHNIPGWDKDLVEIHRGGTATFYVPNTTLFLLLKIKRLSEADLDDCLQVLQHTRAHAPPLDTAPLDTTRVIAEARRILAAGVSEGHRLRMETLLTALLQPRGHHPPGSEPDC